MGGGGSALILSQQTGCLLRGWGGRGQSRYVHREGLHCGGGGGGGGSVLIRGYLLPWAATPLRRAPPPLAFVAPGVPLKYMYIHIVYIYIYTHIMYTYIYIYSFTYMLYTV